jgi:hypothetical protein
MIKVPNNATAALMVASVVLFACSDETTDQSSGSGGSNTGGSQTGGAGGAGGIGGAGGMEHDHGTGTVDTHIHSVQFYETSKSLIVGTHDGLFRTESGATDLVPVMLGPDFMGFLQSPFVPTTYYGSGHYAAGGFANWGFVQSVDSGANWTEVSLSGTADFHEMAASPDAQGLVAGSWNGQLHVSSDSGLNWDSYAWTPDVTGMEIADTNGPVLLLASAAGIDEVTLPPVTTSTIVTASVTSLDRHGVGYVYATSDGQLHLCDAQLTACDVKPGPAGTVAQVLSDPDDLESLFVLTSQSDVFHAHGDGAWELLIDGN